jgi:AraC family transcriptional regulator of adaptative response/methylated-DNA-[protein]-cysteine methyltransferase
MRRAWWRAVLRRDASFDGRFVFGVTTTAVYCRPGCPARSPRREHVVFFRGAREAQREGFRACRRCGSLPGGLLAACEYIARHLEEPLTLERIARHVGWSPFHLQRVFRRGLGVSPRGYARRLRLERFRRGVRKGGVERALHAAGFGSSSRLYERALADLGMSPATLARRGAGMRIAYDVFDGALVAATPLGICSVELGGGVRDLRRRYPEATITRSPALLRFAKERLRAFFKGLDPGLPFDVRATAFQARVWAALRAIPAGETRSYAEVAKAIGRPAAARAVARACASNPVALLVPCHRVLGSDGALRGYRWGPGRKAELLRRERKALLRRT